MTMTTQHHSEPAREAVARREEQLRIQAVGAAISRRDWHAVEQAYNTIRDEFDRRPVSSAAVSEAKDEDALFRALIEELRPYAAKPLGTIRVDTDDVRKIVEAFDRLSASPAPAAGVEAVREAVHAALKQAASGGASGLADYELEQIADDLLSALSAPPATGKPNDARSEAAFVSAFLRIAAQRRDVPESVRRQIVKAAELLNTHPSETGAGVGVKVRELEWVDDGEHYRADAGFEIKYSVFRQLDGLFDAVLLGTAIGHGYFSATTAKEACQADYETRILSALASEGR